MPNKKKKVPGNAFYFFMVHFRKEREGKGFRLSKMNEVADAAAPIWNNMSQEEKAPFEELAKQAKLKDKTNLHNKFTSQGKSYAQLQQEEKERRDKENRMVQEIHQTVHSLDAASGLVHYPFYFAHVNYYCQREGNYYPCEIAISRFTLRKGIDDAMHSIIELDEIPAGYLYEATKTSEETHQIPLPPNNGERDFRKLLMKIRSFLMETREDSTLPPVYTLPIHISPVANVLEFLENSTGGEEVMTGTNYRVYPITKLFFELRKASAQNVNMPGFRVETLAERELEKDMFNFTPGISCNYHEQKDSMQYCSLSIVKRWCFLISDHCCQDVGVPLIPGSHVPILSDTSRNMKPEVSSGPTVANGAIPKAKTMPITIVDHSKEPVSEKDVRHFNISGAGDIPVRGKTPAPPPLRQPNTMPQAIAGVLKRKEPKFTPEDFPAIGGGSLIGKIPMAVAGRGRSSIVQPKENTTPNIGRGRGLAATLAAMKLD